MPIDAQLKQCNNLEAGQLGTNRCIPDTSPCKNIGGWAQLQEVEETKNLCTSNIFPPSPSNMTTNAAEKRPQIQTRKAVIGGQIQRICHQNKESLCLTFSSLSVYQKQQSDRTLAVIICPTALTSTRRKLSLLSNGKDTTIKPEFLKHCCENNMIVSPF